MKKINQIISEVFNQQAESFEEIYAFPEKLFHLFGIYGGKRERAGLSVLMFFYMWFNLLLPVFYSIFAIYSFESLDDVHKIFETMVGISASINSLVKVLAYYRYGDEVSQLKRTAIDALKKYNREDSPMEKGHAVKVLRIMSIINKYITIIYTFCGIIFVTLPIFYYVFHLHKGEWPLPLSMRIFFTDSKSHPGFELNYFISAFTVMNLCEMLAANDLTFMLLCFYVFIQLTICKSHCLKIGDTSSGQSPHQQYAHLRKCIILFENICAFVKDVARLYVWTIFMQCIVSVLIITSSVLYLKYSAANSYGILGSIVIEVIVYCWIGQLILNMSNEVSGNVYFSKWRPTLKDRKFSRSFLFFLKQSQIRNELSAFGLVQLSFTTLMQVMKTSFSYVTFVHNVTY